MIFYPTHLTDDFEFEYFKNIEEQFFKVDEQTRLHGLHFKVHEPKGIVLYFHGNTRSLDDWGYVAQDFRQHGWEVFMIDYRTYGKSRGILSEKSLYEDSERAYEYTRQFYEAKDIIIFGRSLGTGIATYLASKHDARLLALETPYLSMLAMVKKVIPFVPSFLMKYTFQSDKYIKDVRIPIEIIHGTNDTLIPVEQAEKLSNINPSNTNIVIIKGGGHNNLLEYQIYKDWLSNLLR